MLFLAKLLPIFVLPLGVVLALALVGLVRRKRGPVVAALVLLYVSSMPVVGRTLTTRLEKKYPAVPVNQVAQADAIVPLGGIFGPAVPAVNAGYVPNLGEANERLEAGIALWQQKKADWLVFTGGRTPWSRQTEVEGDASKRAAIARGVPADHILVTSEVGNTADEARTVRDLMRARGWSSIILVTSAWHMPRAASLFQKAGVRFVPFAVDYQVDPDERLTLLDFLPRAEALQKTESALREWYGVLYYGMRSTF
jgi:uncharacterized SAM-binding protein YcdF (DUF218 family)